MKHKTKYVVHGGHISSRSDGDVHFINPRELAKLYHLPPSECTFISARKDDKNLKLIWMVQSPEIKDGQIHVYPRDDGNYEKNPKLKYLQTIPL